MNFSTYQMIGHPKHVPKALEAGVDLICAQAGEGGGHTGDMPASILIPAVVDEVTGKKSPLTGGPILVIGAGAVYDGRGLAANLAWALRLSGSGQGSSLARRQVPHLCISRRS
jgi:NAD(P)H-dependent flavin oxidoreductase YrpB (nitropropane dioxygenase family)